MLLQWCHESITLSQIISNLIVYSTVCLDCQPRKYKSFTLLDFCKENPSVTSGFSSQRASNVSSVSMSRLLHVFIWYTSDENITYDVTATRVWWDQSSKTDMGKEIITIFDWLIVLIVYVCPLFNWYDSRKSTEILVPAKVSKYKTLRNYDRILVVSWIWDPTQFWVCQYLV